jgi:hypothetical protein
MPKTTAETTPSYDRNAILHEDGPFDPGFMNEAICALMRNLPLGATESRGWAYRRMHSAMTALCALQPRDEIEVMLGVQALSAYHAASACWRIGMNLRQPNGDSTRHITSAATAARTFDSMLRAIERRQAKPLSVPIGRPEPKAWAEADPAGVIMDWQERCLRGEDDPEPQRPVASEPTVTWTAEDMAIVDDLREQERIEEENKGLDIANTEGILPDGSIVMPEYPTPQQEAYIARRLNLMYQRELLENRRLGNKKKVKFRPLRTGDLVR